MERFVPFRALTRVERFLWPDFLLRVPLDGVDEAELESESEDESDDDDGARRDRLWSVDESEDSRRRFKPFLAGLGDLEAGVDLRRRRARLDERDRDGELMGRGGGGGGGLARAAKKPDSRSIPPPDVAT